MSTGASAYHNNLVIVIGWFGRAPHGIQKVGGFFTLISTKQKSFSRNGCRISVFSGIYIFGLSKQDTPRNALKIQGIAGGSVIEGKAI